MARGNETEIVVSTKDKTNFKIPERKARDLAKTLAQIGDQGGRAFSTRIEASLKKVATSFDKVGADAGEKITKRVKDAGDKVTTELDKTGKRGGRALSEGIESSTRDIADKLGRSGTEGGRKLSTNLKGAIRGVELMMEDVGRGMTSAFNKIGDGASRVKTKAGNAFDMIGNMAGKMAPLIMTGVGAILALGAAIGVTLVASIKRAMDIASATAQLKAQLGLTIRAAAQAGLVAGSVYKNAWGDSIETVNQTIRAVGNNLVDLNKVGRKQLEDLTTRAQFLADTFGVDVNQSVRVVGQLVKTGMAKNFTEAFDIITRGYQMGADQADDFLDTLTEYPTQFRKLGIDGPYALNLISAGLKAGARDADIVADSIKEFSIRAIDGSVLTAQGFKDAGLNMKAMAREIAKGGPTARKAFQETLDAVTSIHDPVIRERAGVALFGTQWEDMGPIVTKAMAEAGTGIKDFAGTTDRAMGDAGSTVAGHFETIKRRVEASFTEIGAALIPLADQVATVFEDNIVPKIEGFADWFSHEGKFRIAETIIGITQSFLTMAANISQAFGQMIRSTSKVLGELATRAGMVAMAMGDEELGAALLGAGSSFKTFGEDAADALDNGAGKLREWSTTLGNTKKELKLRGDISELDRKIRDAKAKLADKKLTNPEKSKLRADISRLTAARNRAQAQLNTLKRTAPVSANLSPLQRALRQYRPRGVTAPVYANLGPLARALRQYRPQGIFASSHGGILGAQGMAHGGISGAMGKAANSLGEAASKVLTHAAEGGPRGNMLWTGEHGPELVELPPGAMVHSNPDSERMVNQTGGRGSSIHITLQIGERSIGEIIVDPVLKLVRTNGSVKAAISKAAGKGRQT